VGGGPWAVGSGRRAVGGGQWAVGTVDGLKGLHNLAQGTALSFIHIVEGQKGGLNFFFIFCGTQRPGFATRVPC